MFGHKRVFKILIVEDREVNHPLYRKVFEGAGFAVTLVSKIDDAFIENVCQVVPDIVAMDLMIEDDVTQNPFAGFELLYLLKQDRRTVHIPVMILSAFFEESKVLKAKELGAVDFVNTSGNTLQSLPKIFLNYLENPREYKPTHPLFRG